MVNISLERVADSMCCVMLKNKRVFDKERGMKKRRRVRGGEREKGRGLINFSSVAKFAAASRICNQSNGRIKRPPTVQAVLNIANTCFTSLPNLN